MKNLGEALGIVLKNKLRCTSINLRKQIYGIKDVSLFNEEVNYGIKNSNRTSC